MLADFDVGQGIFNFTKNEEIKVIDANKEEGWIKIQVEHVYNGHSFNKEYIEHPPKNTAEAEMDNNHSDYYNEKTFVLKRGERLDLSSGTYPEGIEISISFDF